jgi:hypothetical protein
VRRKAESSTLSPPTGGSRRRSVRLSEGHQPLKLTRRVRFRHGPLDDSPGGGTGRRAGLRRTCPRGVGVRISPRRLIGRCCGFPRRGRCPVGFHEADPPGSIPGPGTAGGPVLGRVSYARRRRFDSPTRNCLCSRHGTLTGIAARSRAWCLWVRLPPVLLARISSRRLAAKTPVSRKG